MDRDLKVYKEIFDGGKTVYELVMSIGDLINLSPKKWVIIRQELLIECGEVYVDGADHQYSKLAFTCKIDEMRKE